MFACRNRNESHALEKVCCGGALPLDKEYGAFVTPKEWADEHPFRVMGKGQPSSNIEAGS
jgi:hypothetical protein